MSVWYVSNPVLETVDTIISKTEQGPLQTKDLPRNGFPCRQKVAIPSPRHSLFPALPLSPGHPSPRTWIYFLLRGQLGKMRREAGWIALSLPFLEEKMVNEAVSQH